MAFHVMIIPSMNCPSDCSYCWGVDRDSRVMDMETVREMVSWLMEFRNEPATFTFHGGEPLLAGYEFYRDTLKLISERLSFLKPAFAIQTNLWLMTDEMAELFAEYSIPIGSSLDGPREINDYQRGDGYFDRTMQGYEIARKHGLRVSFISTFTSYSIRRREEIFNFFLENGMNLKLHPALPSLKSSDPEEWAITAEEYGDLLLYLLDSYLEHFGEIEIQNIDHFAKSAFLRRGVVCTHADCVGNTFAVDPYGDIYPCYRFVGMKDYIMGNVAERPSMEDLEESEALRRLYEWRELVDEECGDCDFYRFCLGGCPYNAITIRDGEMEIDGVDHQCEAYKTIFAEINRRANREFLESGILGGNKKIKRPGVLDIMMK